MRSCVGCRQTAEPKTMVRLVLGPEGEVAFDLAGRSFGRGAWVHARSSCLERAARGGLAKGLRHGVRLDLEQLSALLVAAAERRAHGLLASARGAGQLVVGGDEVGRAVESGRAQLVIVAEDALSAAKAKAVSDARARGRAVWWGTKAELGSVAGKEELAVVAVLSARLAGELARTIALGKVGSQGETGAPPRTASPAPEGAVGDIAAMLEVR